MDEADVFGPIEFALLEFPDQKLTGEFAASLMGVVDAGIIQVYDIAAIRTAADGSVSGFELSELDGSGGAELSVFAGARTGLLADSDVAEAGAVMKPNTIAVLLVYESLWAVPMVAAAHAEGGRLLAGAMVSAQDIVDRLDTLDAAGSENEGG